MQCQFTFLPTIVCLSLNHKGDVKEFVLKIYPKPLVKSDRCVACCIASAVGLGE